MAFNLFKKKQQEKPQVKEDPPLAKTQEKQEQASKAQPDTGKKAKKPPVLSGVLLNPHITEKAAMLQEMGQYVFRVHKDATKGAVRGSVESLYGVSVKKVRLIKKPTKKMRIGKKEGIKQGLKKAVVQLKQGENIETLSR